MNEAEEALRHSLEQTARAQRVLLALSQAAQAVQRSRTPDEAYRTVGDEVVALGYHAVIFTLTDDRAHLAISHLTFEPALLRSAEKLTGLSAQDYRFPLVPGGLYQRIIDEGEASFGEPIVEFFAEALPERVRPLADRLAALLGIKPSILAPLTIGGEMQGLLVVGGAGLTEADVPAVTAFASQTAIAIDNARLYEAAQRELTERKRAEEEIKHLQEYLQLQIDRMPIGLIVWDTEFQVQSWNPAAEKIFGFTAQEALGKHPYDLIVPKEAQPHVDDIWNRLLKGDMTAYSINDNTTKDGRTIVCDWANTPLKEADGTVVGVLSMVQDITERKRAEEALRESEEKYRTILENIEEGYFEVDIVGNFTFFNDSLRRIIGYSRDEMMGMNNRQYMDKENAKKVFQAFNRVHTTGKPTKGFDWEIIRKDGTRRFVEASISLTRNSKGEPSGFRGTVRDITERKRAEKGLEHTLEKLRKALGATIQAMALTVEAKDAYTAGHQQRSTNLARAIATKMGLSEEQIDSIRMAGVIHDIGKISVPGEILSKPGRLTDIEFSLIRTHPQVGYDILKPIEFPWPVAQIVLQHHERIDGSGYPAGLTRDEIMLEARILAVADVVEAMSSHRPYRPAWSIDEALGEIRQNRGVLYDPEVVDACLTLFRDEGFELEHA